MTEVLDFLKREDRDALKKCSMSDWNDAGKVGTGYDEETLRRLHSQLAGLERSTSPFEHYEEKQ